MYPSVILVVHSRREELKRENAHHVVVQGAFKRYGVLSYQPAIHTRGARRAQSRAGCYTMYKHKESRVSASTTMVGGGGKGTCAFL